MVSSGKINIEIQANPFKNLLQNLIFYQFYKRNRSKMEPKIEIYLNFTNEIHTKILVGFKNLMETRA